MFDVFAALFGRITAIKNVVTAIFLFLAENSVTAAFTAHLVARLLARRVSMFTGPAAEHAPVLFALSEVRIRPDAEVLAASGAFHIKTLPRNDQFRVQHRFFPGGRDASLHAVDPEIAANAKRFGLFLDRMFPIFLKMIGAQAVIGANFWYKQDIHWGNAAQRNGFPYLVLFRESLKVSETEKQALTDRCRRLGTFAGHAVLTHNNVVRDILLDSGYCTPEQAVTTGAPRMSRFIVDVVQGRYEASPQTGSRKTVTLFSFTPGISLNMLGTNPWPHNPYEGWVRLFERAHSAFAELAGDHSEINFVIKPKWDGKWRKRILQAVSSRGLDADELPNLTITALSPAHDLIRQSSAIVAFASTTLLEAGAAGRKVIVPDFEEAKDPYYRQHIKLMETYDLFTPAESVESYKRAIIAAVNGSDTAISVDCMRRRRAFFSNYVSPLDRDPLQYTIDYISSVLK